MAKGRKARQDDPSVEQRDLLDFLRLLGRLKGNRRMPTELREQCLFHGKALAKLLVDFNGFASLDPDKIAEKEKLEDERSEAEERHGTETETNGARAI